MLNPVIKFVRLRIIVTSYALTFLGSIVAGSVPAKIILILPLLIFWYIHSASVNDYTDREIDAVNLQNAPDRPLLKNELTSKYLWIIHFVSGMLALLCAALLSWNTFIFCMAMIILAYLYSIKPVRISDRGIYSQLLLGIAYAFYPFTLGYWAVGTAERFPWLLMLGLYTGFIARLLLKDFRDVKGDKKFGKLTFLLRHGALKTCQLSAILWLIAVVFIGLSVDFSIAVMVPLILGCSIAFRWLYLLAKLPPMRTQLTLISFIAKGANYTIVTVMAYFLCQHQPGLSSTKKTLFPLIIGTLLLAVLWFTSRQDRRRVA